MSFNQKGAFMAMKSKDALKTTERFFNFNLFHLLTLYIRCAGDAEDA